jgi:hypothetical protein
MITPEHRKELFSISYVAAIAGQAGANFSFKPEHFDYGIDVEFKEVISRRRVDGSERLVSSGVLFLAQLKCTEGLREIKDNPDIFSYDLDADTYNDLVSNPQGSVKKILLVVDVPQENERLHIALDEHYMRLSRLAYWLDLSTKEPTQNSTTQVVHIPKANVLTPDVIKNLFTRIKDEE